MKTYSLISSIKYFDYKSKIHISKSEDEVNTICGKNLGFDYEPQTQNGELVLHSIDEILKQTNICKICINSLKNSDKSQLNK